MQLLIKPENFKASMEFPTHDLHCIYMYSAAVLYHMSYMQEDPYIQTSFS